MPPRILLEGRPGVGKTTVAQRLAQRLRHAGVPVVGFTTGELRAGDRREGFRVARIDAAEEAVLAHVDLPGPPRVGRYGVDLAAFERVALPKLTATPVGAVVVIDELGKMELASAPFCDAVEALLSGPAPVVATVHAHRHPFTDALKARDDLEVVAVTRSNRDRLPEELATRLRA